MTQFNSLLPIRDSRYCWARNVWAFIKQVLPECFPSYGVWLNQLNHVKWSGQLISASQSLIIYQHLSINAIQSKRWISSRHFFPIIHHRSVFSTHVRWVSYLNLTWWRPLSCRSQSIDLLCMRKLKKQEDWNLCCSILKILMVN